MIEDCVNLNYAYQKRTWNDLSCDASDVYALCERGLSSNPPFFLNLENSFKHSNLLLYHCFISNYSLNVVIAVYVIKF